MSAGLRTRFTLWFSGAALVPIVATTVIAWWQISTGYRDDFARKLATAEDTARRELDRLRSAVTSAVDAARENPVVDQVAFELFKSGDISPTLQHELERHGRAMMHSLGLQIFMVVGGDDTVLAAPHFIGQVYQKDPEPRRLATAKPGVPVVAWAKVLADNKVTRVLVLQAARAVKDERGHELIVLGGRELGAELLRPLGGEGISARLVDGRGADLGPRPARAAPAGFERDMALEDASGTPIAHLRVTVSDAALRRRLRDLGLLNAGLGLFAVLFAAGLGLVVSRRLTRDVEALATGVEAVSRGDLEVQVAVRARDEVGQLATAFNRMTQDLRESKEALIQAERVAAWQDIARSLAHELKNPLTPIQMSVETLRKTWAAQHRSFAEIFDESTRTVLEEVQRLKRIIGEFSQFARMPQPERRPCDLNELVASALGLYQGAVKVVKELAPVLPRIEADRDQLTQVVLNLLENARHAVTSRGSEDSLGRISVRTRIKGNGVELEVADNGPGFDPALKEKLFQPYFTTKETGTGLGLAIVRRIVTDHGGRISAHGEPGKGARFVVELPASGATFMSVM